MRIVAVALQVSLFKLRHAGQRLFAVAHAVRFEVGLSHHIKTVLVTEVVPTRVVRIVAGTHRVDVELLHHADVLHHALHTHHVAPVGVEFVAVGPLDQNRLAVDQQLCAFHFHLAEAHVLRQAFQHLLPVAQIHAQCIEVRSLCRPFERVFNVPEHFGLLLTEPDCLRLHRVALFVSKGEHGLFSLAVLRSEAHGERTVAVIVGEVGRDEEVGNVALRTGIEINLAGNAGETPEVLVLEIGTVAPAHHLHGNEVVLAHYEVRRKVEFSGHFGILTVAHELAIHPHAEIGSGRAYMEIDLLSLPVCRHLDGTAVRPRVVVLLLHEGGIGMELRGPGIANIFIDRVAVAVEFKQSGHREEFPAAVVVASLEEVLGSIIVMEGEMELPLAFQGEVTRRFLLVGCCGCGHRLISKEVRMRSQGVHPVHGRVEPIRRLPLLALGTARQHRCCGQCQNGTSGCHSLEI